MEKMKEKIVWVVICITIIYSMTVHYIDSKKVEFFFAVGLSIGFLALPFLLSLLVGLYFYIRKNFSWIKVRKAFVIIWIPVMIFIILFFPTYGILCKKDIMPQLKELVKQQTIETNIQRRLYYNRLVSINVANISKIEDVKDIELLMRAKNNITKQKEIEDWNYLAGVSLLTKWEAKFQAFLKENTSKEASQIITEQDSTYKELSNSILEKKRIQNDYFAKYNKQLDFLITQNSTISIKNNTVMFKNDDAVKEYSSNQQEYAKALKLYQDYEANWKKESTNDIDKFNKKYFNLKECDTLINTLRNDKYEK